MELIYHYHHNSKELAPNFNEYNEIITILESIKDQDLIEEFNNRKLEGVQDRKGKSKKIDTSISKVINIIVKENFLQYGWKEEARIFSEPYYAEEKEFRLDFAKSDISIEVAFNHSGAVSWNIIKPFLASQFNHVKKDIQTRMGVVITVTKEFRKSGGFDSAIGTFEDYVAYFKPLSMLTLVPIVVIGILPPKTFYIETKKDSKINRNVGKIIMKEG